MIESDKRSTPAQPPDVQDADFHLLLEVGLLATDEGLYDAAEVILSALAAIRQCNPHPRIGLALIAHGRGSNADAIEQLDAVLADFPAAVFTRSLKAYLMKTDSRSGWQAVALEAIAFNASGVAAELANTVLSESDRPASYQIP